MNAALLISGLMCAAPVATQVVKQGPILERPAPAANFNGAFRLRILTPPTAPGQAGTSLVRFLKRERSVWHSYPAGQTLYVMSGSDWMHEEGDPVRRVCQGDAVYMKPSVNHLHVATTTTAMTHAAISESLDSENVDRLEPVDMEQYCESAR